MLLLYAVFQVLLLVVYSAAKTGDLSKSYCDEYGKAVYIEEFSPVLLPRARASRVSVCGMVSVPLIVGGTKAAPQEFPHMALIGFGTDHNSSMLAWMCGGALISNRYVLTAAHCTHSKEIGPAQKVRLGAISLLDVADDYIQELNVAERISHPDYHTPVKYHDVALLRLENTVEFTAYVRPACLNTLKDDLSRNGLNIKAWAIGFGKLSYDSNFGSDDLMKVSLTVYPNDVCRRNFAAGRMSVLPNGITDSMLCAGQMDGKGDTCQGDSGGPLQVVLDEPYCMYSVIGITSFGKFCGFAKAPAIYSNVADYVDWIESIVWK